MVKRALDWSFDRSPRSLAGLYVALGGGAVPLLDRCLVVVGVTSSAPSLPLLVGGWLLVGFSSVVLYGATTYHARRAAVAHAELETSNQQLQVLSRVFRHNVRNDLNVVQGYTGLLRRQLDDERSRERLETIRDRTENIVRISEKLRAIEEASTDRADGRVDLSTVVAEAVAELDTDGVTVDIETPETAWIRADESVSYPVREVFENAIAHNDDPTRRVVARIDENGSTTCLSVDDNGPGIPATERAVLQAEAETPLSHASSIGLWLVKWLCELQGGTVQFDTTDAGTTVQLRFRSADGPRAERTRLER
ncbi:MAG: HAMP domain-containing sensor histidine kinase [Halorubrum sp.]